VKAQAKAFEDSAKEAMARLGYELFELPRWNCCGTVFSLSTDDLMRHLGPVRNLIRVQGLGENRLVTLCSMCYNTLKRSAAFVTRDPERLQRINAFLDDEEDYQGRVEVVHLLSLLRDEVGFSKIEEKVVRPLFGLRVAPYYGCTLLRPREAGIDDPDRPRVMEDLFCALGAEVVDSPYKVECCGAWEIVPRPGVVLARAEAILGSVAARGGQAIALSCPLCHYNLESPEQDLLSTDPTWSPIPVVYFTQLLAVALGADLGSLGFERHEIDPRPLFQEIAIGEGR
jgi:heterodisulfide reductase subunit B